MSISHEKLQEVLNSCPAFVNKVNQSSTKKDHCCSHLSKKRIIPKSDNIQAYLEKDVSKGGNDEDDERGADGRLDTVKLASRLKVNCEKIANE